MRWFANLLLLGGLAGASAAAAQESGSELPPEVHAEIARAWGVSPARVHVQRSDSGRLGPIAVKAFRLFGGGADGRFILVFTEPTPRSPRSIRLRAGLRDTVIVASGPLARGRVLQKGDYVPALTVLWGPPAPIGAHPSEGWTLRRSVATGERIAPFWVSPPEVVAKGSAVHVRWVRGSVTVSAEGTALHAAPLDAPVLVRLANRRGTVRGRVVSSSEIHVGSSSSRHP